MVLALTSPAHAQTSALVGDDDSLEEQQPTGSYFTVAFRGGLLMPMGDMSATHDPSLAAGMRLGWTGRHGVGVDGGVEYSPLGRKDALPGQSFEIHFATATVAPRFTLGKGAVRLWVSAGAGVAYERTLVTIEDGGRSSDDIVAPLAIGAAGLELFPLNGVGLAVTGRVSQAFGDLGYQFAEVTGGLVLSFR